MTEMKEYIKKRLFDLQDKEYAAFQSKLMPTVDPQTVIGVRIPLLRKLAKEIVGRGNYEEFLKDLPHTYYEENNLHAILLEHIKDYENCIDHINQFLPYVDNWATCDSIIPRIFKKHLNEVLKEVDVWIHSDKTYTIRFGIGTLMRFFLDDAFRPEYPQMVAEVVSDEYYVNMMSAWYFATALAKQYNAVIPYLQEKRLDNWVHNKTIQKSVESYRVTGEHKEYLRSLRVK